MKTYESDKAKAISLRMSGSTLNEICAIVKKGKSTVFEWIRHIDIDIKNSQTTVNRRINSCKAIQKMYKDKRQSVYDRTSTNAKEILKDSLVRDFVVSYFCEGSKTQRGRLEFTNTDPSVIKLFLMIVGKFTTKPCRFRLLCHEKSEEFTDFWATELSIPKGAIKTTLKPGNISKNKFKFGTFKAEICDTYAMSQVSALIDVVLDEWNDAYSKFLK